jgi:hypothetical protein
MKCHAFDMWINGFTAGCQRLITNGLSIRTLKIKYGISETKYDCLSISNREGIFLHPLDISTCRANRSQPLHAVQSNLVSTHRSCAKQIVFHKPHLCKATYCPHTTAVQNKLFSINHSCAKQLIVRTPQPCKTTLSTHHSCAKQLTVHTPQL